MTCECCHCCFCCCEQNYDNNPNPTKKPKVETPVTRTTQIPKPPVVTDRSEPVIQWPDELIPGPPTVEEWMERPPIEIIRANNDAAEEEEQFSFPPKTTEPPPPVLGCMDPLATNYNPLATQNDGSCIYPPPPVLGCMDPLATNYNPLATQNDGSCIYPPPQIRLTPIEHEATYLNYGERINWSTTLTVSKGYDHSPDPSWAGTSWTNWDWDGVPIDISNKTPSQICALLFKNGYFMKGLRQVYYAKQPFANPLAPTITEIDNWNIEVIRHLRRLVGNTTPVEGDPKLYLEAQWAHDRYYTNIWDTRYPGTDGTAFGPCQPGLDGNAHCGGAFIPNFTDQAKYLPQYPGLQAFNRSAQAEGIGPVNTDLPWALKLTHRISAWICSEGTTGHAGPFFTRTKVGMSFFTGGTSTAPGATTVLRVKWSG